MSVKLYKEKGAGNLVIVNEVGGFASEFPRS